MGSQVKDLNGKDFDIESIYNDKYLKTVINSNKGAIKLDFFYDGLPLEKMFML